MRKKMDGAGNIVRMEKAGANSSHTSATDGYYYRDYSWNERNLLSNTTDALMTKNIFLGTERIVTKQCSKDAREGFAEAGTQSEADQQYYYHADHLGSVSAITDVVTFGAGLVDDPATSAIGASLVVGALGIAAYSNKKSDTISVSVAKVESKTKENNKGPYSVKLQFQGPSIQGASRNTGEGCVEVKLRSDKPIPVSAVELTVSEK